MGLDNKTHYPDGSPIGDVAYLARSEHRIPTLVALTERPQSRTELCESTGVSPSTIRRTLGAFEDRNWVRRDGYRYEATRSGAAIAAGMEEMLDRLETDRTLRDVWHRLPGDIVEMTIETNARTLVTVPDRYAPYRPVRRFESLLQEADRARILGVDAGLYEPCSDEFRERVLDGMEVELVAESGVVEHVFSPSPDRDASLLECDNLTALVHDDPPSYGLGLFARRIAISGCDPDSGGIQVLIDSALPEAREWAQSVYDSYEAEARPIERQSFVG